MAAQYIGAFLGACAVHSIYFEAINKHEEATNTSKVTPDTAGIYATYPQPYFSNGVAFWEQVISF